MPRTKIGSLSRGSTSECWPVVTERVAVSLRPIALPAARGKKAAVWCTGWCVKSGMTECCSHDCMCTMLYSSMLQVTVIEVAN
jgi:hypothetical protein